MVASKGLVTLLGGYAGLAAIVWSAGTLLLSGPKAGAALDSQVKCATAARLVHRNAFGALVRIDPTSIRYQTVMTGDARSLIATLRGHATFTCRVAPLHVAMVNEGEGWRILAATLPGLAI